MKWRPIGPAWALRGLSARLPRPRPRASTARVRAADLPPDRQVGAEAQFNPSIADALWPTLTPVVNALVGNDLVRDVAFYRIYRPGAVLRPHRDREGLDWTIGWVVGCSGGAWPIHMEAGVVVTSSADDALLFPGRRVKHRRPAVVGGADTYLALLMLHWTAV